MRQFIIFGHETPADPSFSLDDLAGGAGRLDVLCRCVNSAVFLSHGMREDTKIQLVLSDTYRVEFDGKQLQYLHPDERTIASRIKNALENADMAIGHQPAEPSPGVKLYRMDTRSTVEAVAEQSAVIQLHESGTPITDVDMPQSSAFVLSDHQRFTTEEQEVLDEVVEKKISVGPKAIHANHAITVVHNYLDTERYRQYE